MLDRLDECETHNTPVRVLREHEQKLRHEEVAREIDELERRAQARYDARMDEIAKAIETGQTLRVAYDAYDYGGKSPVLDLFKLYDIKLPLRTQGWVKTGLAEVSEGSYRYFKSKHKRDSSAYMGYYANLRGAIRLTPIEQKRASLAPATPAAEVEGIDIGGETPRKEEDLTVEQALYQTFAERFPRFMSGELQTLRLEAPHAKSLELQWIFGDRISIAHTYELNGEPAYEPRIELLVDNKRKALQVLSFELSEPPRLDHVYFKGIENAERKHHIETFLTAWLERADKQRFRPVAATIDHGGEDVPVTFDENGELILTKPEKQYDLGYGFLGNGITVWNRAEEKDGDYATVAHIDTDRSVTFYDKEMPHEVKERIDAVAKSSDTRAFGFSAAPEVTPPHLGDTPAPASVYEAVKRVMPETALPKAAAFDMPLPDPLTSAADRDAYGYTHDEMLPMSTARALELFDAGNTVYLLHPDNTEAIAFDHDEILGHGGLCGIERADWESSPAYAAQMAIVENAEGSRESELLYGDGNCFGIYQIKGGQEMKEHIMSAGAQHKDSGLSVHRGNYELVYTAPLNDRIEFLSDRYSALNRLYQEFNTNYPEDYTARSVSLSDVIVLKYNGDVASFYVDATCFMELDGFLGDETGLAAAQQAQERSNGVIYLTAQDRVQDRPQSFSQVGKGSKTIGLQAHSKVRGNGKKPSLLGKLEQNKQKAARAGESDAAKPKEREEI